MYHSSTQRRHWTFRTEEDLCRRRADANRKFRCKAVANGKVLQTDSFLLEPQEERTICKYYEKRLLDFCSVFKPAMPRSVVGFPDVVDYDSQNPQAKAITAGNSGSRSQQHLGIPVGGNTGCNLSGFKIFSVEKPSAPGTQEATENFQLYGQNTTILHGLKLEDSD